MTKIMIIRHAEKPGDADPDHGVTVNGAHDGHDLTVRGWQRAGALGRFFAPIIPFAADSPIATPVSIFASAASAASPSHRAKHTVKPLAALLGIKIDCCHPNGRELDIAAAATVAPSPVLIAWHHSHIVLLARLIGGATLNCPSHWPDDCFDAVWVLDKAEDGSWSFAHVAQNLLARDRHCCSRPVDESASVRSASGGR